MTSPPLANGNNVALADKVRALSDPRCYPHASDGIETIETHFAWIFLAGEFAYKLKKPIKIERMDFRALAERKRVCMEELRLNRRLAPDVYLDVVALSRDEHSRWRLDHGEALDWLVKMRRLPAHLMLDRAIADGTVKTRDVHSVANWLARFYLDQLPEPLTSLAYRERVIAQIESNRRELLADDLGLPREQVQTTLDLQADNARSIRKSIEQRAEHSKIVEAHGDLRPEHIYLGTPPCIIDCLEFDRELRILDPVEELAFLLLECERLNASWVADEFFSVYRNKTQDDPPPVLIDFYFAHRAVTRAKIAAWHLRDEEVRDKADWRALACDYLRRARVRLQNRRYENPSG